MNTIISNQNPLIKELKLLKERKYREEKKLYFIEGLRFVEEAIKESAEIVKIYISEKFEETKGGKEILFKINDMQYDTIFLTDKLFREVSDTENPQGILATIKVKTFELTDLSLDLGFFLILDSIQDPGNMGTIIRTADAANANGIIVLKGCVDVYNPKVLRATMGSIFHQPIYFYENAADLIARLKEKGIKVFASHLKGSSNYFEHDFRENIAFVIGNEANGINEEIALLADELVRIPMPGRAESLNASVAASLLMYEVVRQRLSNK